MNRETINRVKKIEDKRVPPEHQITLIQLVDAITGEVMHEMPVKREDTKVDK